LTPQRQQKRPLASAPQLEQNTKLSIADHCGTRR
jgi:hypothetical protein